MESKDFPDEVRILMIEGVVVDDEVKIRYKLPPINSDMMKDFYHAFIVQLCTNIAKLEGSEGLFEIVEGEDG